MIFYFIELVFDYISAFIIFYIRYRQIRTHYEGAGRTKLLKYNTVTFVMGITAALGISLVGNFQVQLYKYSNKLYIKIFIQKKR